MKSQKNVVNNMRLFIEAVVIMYHGYSTYSLQNINKFMSSPQKIKFVIIFGKFIHNKTFI